jgi:hypothetical protein
MKPRGDSHALTRFTHTHTCENYGCGVSDSLLVVNWCNAQWPVRDLRLRDRVKRLLDLVGRVLASGVCPRRRTAHLFRHIFREQNGVADELSKSLVDGVTLLVPISMWPRRIRIFSDGSRNERKQSGLGWRICGLPEHHSDEPERWQSLARGSFRLPGWYTVPMTEIAGAESALNFFVSATMGSINLVDVARPVLHLAKPWMSTEIDDSF